MISWEYIWLSWFGLDWGVGRWLSGFLFVFFLFNICQFPEKLQDHYKYPLHPESPILLYPLLCLSPPSLRFWAIWDQVVSLMCHHDYGLPWVLPKQKECAPAIAIQPPALDPTPPSKPGAPFKSTSSPNSVIISFLVQTPIQDHALCLVSSNVKVTAFLCLLCPGKP